MSCYWPKSQWKICNTAYHFFINCFSKHFRCTSCLRNSPNFIVFPFLFLSVLSKCCGAQWTLIIRESISPRMVLWTCRFRPSATKWQVSQSRRSTFIQVAEKKNILIVWLMIRNIQLSKAKITVFKYNVFMQFTFQIKLTCANHTSLLFCSVARMQTQQFFVTPVTCEEPHCGFHKFWYLMNTFSDKDLKNTPYVTINATEATCVPHDCFP